MILKSNSNLEIYIFNVGRGLSILCKTPQNHVLIYDLGSTDGFSPINDVYKEKSFFSQMTNYEGKKIAQTIISHPHLDHISNLTDNNAIFIKNNSALITCQNDKSDNKKGQKIDFNMVNNPDYSTNQIENYKSLYKDRSLPLRTIDPKVENCNFKMGYFYLPHNKIIELYDSDQEYSNSLSIVLYIAYKDYSILIPGDITPEAFKLIIDGKCEKRYIDCSYSISSTMRMQWTNSTCREQPNLITLLQKYGLTFLVTPHHGLESCFPEYLFNKLGEKKPYLNIASEGKHTDKSGNIDKRYQNSECAKGIKFGEKTRYSLTTRNDGHIKIIVSSEGKCTINNYSNYEDMFR